MKISIDSIGEGVINDEGDAEFNVKYSAVTFKPLNQEVMDGNVTQV